jgi:methionyl-tRNA synthetase
MVSYDKFAELDLRVAEIKEAQEHPQADKLLVLKLDVGDLGERTIVAGIKGHYEKDDLVGKKIVIVANLDPVTLRGIKSEGMLLAASDEKKESIVLLTADAESGWKIS